jgi:hypothetical protein
MKTEVNEKNLNREDKSGNEKYQFEAERKSEERAERLAAKFQADPAEKSERLTRGFRNEINKLDEKFVKKN